jgi:hypothetical protein
MIKVEFGSGGARAFENNIPKTKRQMIKHGNPNLG